LEKKKKRKKERKKERKDLDVWDNSPVLGSRKFFD